MRKKKNSGIGNPNTFVRNVIDVFKSSPYSGFNYKQVTARLGITDKASKDLVKSIIEKLCNDGELTQTKRGKYQITGNKEEEKALQTYVTGTVDMKQTGKAYVIPDDKSEDIFIAAINTAHALNGDKVKVFLFPRRKGKKTEGQVVEILKRNKKQFVGTIEVSRNFSFLTPDNPSMPIDIFIPMSALNGARNGQKVIARITEWPPQSENPFGEVIQVLGKPGDNDVEMDSILAEFEFPLSFSSVTENEAEKIPSRIEEKEIHDRKDFREVLTFTIDPADAKDFDDALSFRKLTESTWEVGIHIADVSYFVKPGTALDKEAFQRGTSVYLVDRVIPMLPEKLSNEVCSLKPDTDRLCFSAVFELDENAKVLDEWFGKTVIHSDRRFNYDEVQQIIETGKGDYAGEIRILDRLAKKLREERYKKGSINFETQEVRFKLDDNGKPLEIYLREMKDSNKLIEDFMLLANRKVAEWIDNKKDHELTFVYRVHDKPVPEKLETFTRFISKLGYKLQISTRKNLAQSFNSLFNQIKGKGEENMIETIAVRTMAKAFYTTTNIGHYGLGFQHYTHFTSPIRRYPDLMVHRLLFSYLHQGKSASKEEYEVKCDHSSEMERKAESAERMSVKFKQAEYMLDKIGEEFDGLISGVSKWGIFVEIQGTKCEGMIRLRDLNDDYYYLDEENYQVIGSRKGVTFKLGDPIRIRVKKIDIPRKQMDFALVNGKRSL
ncbi:MAG: ribonuclease R [Bacteroidota bacterium]|nr:ribonuclease R [Bacteroidota bacterium]